MNSTGQLFGLVVPAETFYNWRERTQSYWVFFYIMLIVYGICYLCLAIVSLFLLTKRHLAQRFKVRTFIAIDTALMILGLSRALFIILDPWGQSGFCKGHIACRIISRFLSALAFPSLTASYTLVFITLWSSARIQLGVSSYQRYKYLVPLCFIHYIVAITFEIIGNIPWPQAGAIPVASLLIACEFLFSLWGLLVCTLYLFAGCRLLRSVKKSARSSSVVCRDSPNLTRQQLVEKSRFQNQPNRSRTKSNLKLKEIVRDHHRQAIRKISIIMYFTVVLGILYSLLSLVNLILIILSIFKNCPGYVTGTEQQNPAVWLFLRYIFFTLELCLALLLTYSVNDYRPVILFIIGGVQQCFRLQVDSQQEKQSSALTDGFEKTPVSPLSHIVHKKEELGAVKTPTLSLKVKFNMDSSDTVSDPTELL